MDGCVFKLLQVDINLLVASILDLNENVTMMFEFKEIWL